MSLITVLLALPPILVFVRSFLIPYIRDPYGLNKYPGPFWARFTRIWYGSVARGGKRYAVIHDLHLKHGRFVRIAPNELSILDPDAIPIVLGHGTGTTKSKFYDAFVSIQRGLFNTRDRNDHARKRKIVSHTFSPKNVSEFEPYIARLLNQFLSKWDGLIAEQSSADSDSEKKSEKGNDWKMIDCLVWFNFLAFDIIGDLAFGKPFGMIAKERDEATVERNNKIMHLPAIETINQRGEYSLALGCLPAGLRPWMRYIDSWYARGANSVKNLAGIAVNSVNERLADISVARTDLLARLQEGRDANGNPMSKNELTAEALTQLIAGSDTTSNSSCAILWWIVKHPSAHQKLVAELDDKFGDLDGVLSYEECKNLPYLKACIDEALRRHSTSSIGLPRVMGETVNFKGHILRKGMVCSVPTYDIHHDPEVWGDPWVFRPERWLQPNAKDLDRAYMPFSYGPRACVGRNLAILQLQVIVATLFKRYDFRLKDPTQAELVTSEGFLRKPLECWIEIKRRES